MVETGKEGAWKIAVGAHCRNEVESFDLRQAKYGAMDEQRDDTDGDRNGGTLQYFRGLG